MTTPLRMQKRPRDRAAEGWGLPLSDWMEALVTACEGKETQSAVAARLGMSASQLTQVLGNRYPSPTDKAEASVRAILMGEEIMCPGWGMRVPRRQCLEDQEMPFAASSPAEMAVFRACRAGCPHYRGKKDPS